MSHHTGLWDLVSRGVIPALQPSFGVPTGFVVLSVVLGAGIAIVIAAIGGVFYYFTRGAVPVAMRPWVGGAFLSGALLIGAAAPLAMIIPWMFPRVPTEAGVGVMFLGGLLVLGGATYALGHTIRGPSRL